MENLNQSDVIHSAAEKCALFTVEQMRLVDHLIELRNKKYEAVRGDISATKDLFAKLTGFVEQLKTNHADCNEYLLFHILTSSSCPECTKFDFPGDDSVEKFLINF